MCWNSWNSCQIRPVRKDNNTINIKTKARLGGTGHTKTLPMSLKVFFLLCLVYLTTIFKRQVNYTFWLTQNILLYITSPKSSLYCKDIDRVKNEVDRQPSNLLANIEVSDYKAAFTLMHLVFLGLDIPHCHLDFVLLDENRNIIVPRTFYLQLLNKGNNYIRYWHFVETCLITSAVITGGVLFICRFYSIHL